MKTSSNRQYINDCLGTRVEVGMNYKGQSKTFGGDGSIHYLHLVMVPLMEAYVKTHQIVYYICVCVVYH